VLSPPFLTGKKTVFLAESVIVRKSKKVFCVVPRFQRAKFIGTVLAESAEARQNQKILSGLVRVFGEQKKQYFSQKAQNGT
jgi:hypothetical protein